MESCGFVDAIIVPIDSLCKDPTCTRPVTWEFYCDDHRGKTIEDESSYDPEWKPKKPTKCVPRSRPKKQMTNIPSADISDEKRQTLQVDSAAIIPGHETMIILKTHRRNEKLYKCAMKECIDAAFKHKSQYINHIHKHAKIYIDLT